MTAVTDPQEETRTGGVNGRLNRLRAGVLGANDGIVSVAAIVVGVAGATSEIAPMRPRARQRSSAARSRWRSASTSR